MVVDDLFRIVHAVVTDLDGVAVEDFSKLVVYIYIERPLILDLPNFPLLIV